MLPETYMALIECIRAGRDRQKHMGNLLAQKFYAEDGVVYFGHTPPDSDLGHSSRLIAEPGPDAAMALAAALNRVLDPYKSRQAQRAREAALQLQADIAQLTEELVNKEIAAINTAAMIVTRTEVHKCPACEPKQPELAEVGQ